MGLDCAAVKFLCVAKSIGVDFSSTLMVGRQSFFPLVDTLKRVFTVLDLHCDPVVLLQQSKYAEPFFALLGAKQISSLDVSHFEGATYVQDLNIPLADGLSQRFSNVYDGGTLEHVFNLPQAFKNCMEMVRVGGHFTQLTVANNFMGHGFWQISPELIYRVFAPSNGFQIECVLLHEVAPGGAWYFVNDPEEMGHRIELCNSVPTYILTIAKRMKTTEIFGQTPQQSDYVRVWQRDGGDVLELTRDVEEFDETYYLGTNFDVAQAVKNGDFASGRAHFLSSGRKEGRRGAPGYRRIDEDELLRGRIYSRTRPVS